MPKLRRPPMIGKTFLALIWVVLGSSIGLGQSNAKDSWNQWRGPNRDGSAPGFKAPESWPEMPRQVWRVPVGAGYGSPVMAGNRIIIHVNQGQQDQVICLNAEDGSQIWQTGFPVAFKPNSYAIPFGKGPFATPLVSNGRVIAVGVDGAVVCLDIQTGKKIWQRASPGALTGDRLLFCGNSVSPLNTGSEAVIHVGNETTGQMVALAWQDGSQKWIWKDDIPGYASPLLATFGGVRHLISLTQNYCVGLDPETGTLLWRHDFQVPWRENVPDPLQIGDRLILSGRETEKTTALRIAGKDQQWTASIDWINHQVVMYMASPLLLDGKIFGFSHKKKGSFFCLDAQSGKTLWTSPGRFGENAVGIKAGGALIFLTTEGKLLVLDPSSTEFAPLKTYQLAEGKTWAHPAVTAQGLIIKDDKHLTFWQF